MSVSSEFHLHTGMLHDSLNRLLGRSAVEISPGLVVGTGLLSPRPAEHGYYQPRLIVVSGLAMAVSQLVGETIDDDLLVVGAIRDGDITTDVSRLCATRPGFAKDMLKHIDLEADEIVRYSHSAHIAKPERLDALQAHLFHAKVSQKLNPLNPAQ